MMYGDTAHDGSVYWLTRGRGTDSGMEEYACHGAGFSGNHLIRYCAALVLYYDIIRIFMVSACQ